MKIAFLSDNFLPSVTGVATYLSEISKSLAHRGHKIYIYAPQGKSKEEIVFEEENIKLYFMPSIPSYFYPDFRIAAPVSLSLLGNLADVDPDIIHFHTQFSIGMQSILIAKMLKKPLVGTFHGYFMEPEYLQLFKLHKLHLDKSKTIIDLGWKYSNFFLNQTDMVISPSYRSKKDLIEHGFKKKVKVISNGIDISQYQNKAQKIYDLPKSYFLYAGRISSEKSLDILIKAFYEFCLVNQTTDLVIVGDGPATKKIQLLIKNLRLQKRVHMLGMIDHEILINSNIYKDALAFVTTSKSESQPVSVLEALASKLPVVGVNERGVPELIDKNGIICEADNHKQFAEALLFLVDNPAERKKMALTSYRIAKKHSLEYSTKQLEGLYEQLISKKRNSPDDSL